MSTVHHHPAPLHIWWYAVAAVLAAAVGVLAFTVLNTTTASPGTDVPVNTPVTVVAPKWHPGPACFMTRPGVNTDLAGNCTTHAP